MTNNIQKAKELIQCFASRDIEKAKSFLDKRYIQHNLTYPTESDAFLDAVAGLKAARNPTKVNTIRAFEDGDKVFMHTVYNFAGMGEQVAFDIFRFEDGRIVEYWDVMERIADKST